MSRAVHADLRQPARVLTISATYGAGGVAAAPLLARRLRLPFADRLLDPRGASAQPSEERLTDAELNEEPPSMLLRSLALLGATWNLPPAGGEQDSPERLRGAIEASIQDLVKGGGAVILGRAAAVVLGRRPGAFHVRLDGPPEQRARRGAAWEGVDLATGRDRLAKADAVRNRTVQRLYGRDLSDPSLYHLVIDATALNLDPLLDVIVSAAEATWGYDETRLEDDVAALRARLTGPATSPDVRDR